MFRLRKIKVCCSELFQHLQQIPCVAVAVLVFNRYAVFMKGRDDLNKIVRV